MKIVNWVSYIQNGIRRGMDFNEVVFITVVIGSLTAIMW